MTNAITAPAKATRKIVKGTSDLFFRVNIQNLIEKRVGLFIVLAANVCYVAARKTPQERLGFCVQWNEMRLLDTVSSRKLAHDKLAVEADVDIVDAKLERCL